MKKLLFILLAGALVLSLFGCRERESANGRLEHLLSALGALPAGTVYSSTADPYGTAPLLDDALVASLYAREDGYCEFAECIEEAAVYLGGSGEVYLEAAVFLCYGNADTEAVAAMCLRRARLLERWLDLHAGTVRIQTEGRYVILLATKDPTLAERAERALGS